MNEFQVPTDLGRIPGKIYCETKSLDEIYKKIVDVVMLIEKKYGRNIITPNLHLSLYLSACSHDFGPLYAFWYFSFERINGILGSLLNSHRQIELELMRRLINDNRINEMIYTENNLKGLKILNTRQSVGSLSEMDQFGHDEMRRFWMYSRIIQESTISGKEPFPGEMLKPFLENIPLSADGILDLMIAYYNDTYENLKFRKPFETDSLNSIIIPLKINKYCRCQIGSEIFVEISNIIADNEVLNISSEDEMEEMEEISIESEEESADEFSNIFEDYSSPNYDPDEPINPKSTNDNSYLWILLWIMSFRIKFNLPETVTELLIKFIKLLLSEIRNSEFDTFPNSIYITKKELRLRDDFYSFPTCLKYHKLYNKQEVEDYKENDIIPS
ncbi:hypothetical protein Glove_4g13 [Diversispora epigaea]|uniref:Uncharacterized protein n=1 Tax=Diversispora epigaea TaxID=1348612 RepID=A0A397JRA5_9GLOM|nr:hypothetical protein Glove_4g13 [Diversispora epigaea]